MRYLLFFLWMGVCGGLVAQQDSSQHFFGLTGRYGQVIVHSRSVQNIKGTNPAGLEFEFAKRRTTFSKWNMGGAFAKTGWALGYHQYNNALLGYGITASYFIEPQYRLGNRLYFYYRGGVGAGYFSNPNDPVKNPENRNYSQHITPYFYLASGLGVNISRQVSLSVGGMFHHMSNGELNQPNKGINWLTAYASLLYNPGDNSLPKYKRDRSQNRMPRKLIKEIALFAVPRQDVKPRILAQRNYLLGASIQFTKPISNINGFTFGTQVLFQHFTPKPGPANFNTGRPFMLGVHAGHVFLLGRVHFSQQIGYYAINTADYIPRFHQQYAFTYRFTKRFSTGFSLTTNSDNADYTDVRIIYKL